MMNNSVAGGWDAGRPVSRNTTESDSDVARLDSSRHKRSDRVDHLNRNVDGLSRFIKPSGCSLRVGDAPAAYI